MEVITKNISCDCCKKSDKPTMKIKYPVLFTTDQTEGRATDPYISLEKLDLCADCIQDSIRIRGAGAQGYNEYKSLDPSECIWDRFKVR